MEVENKAALIEGLKTNNQKFADLKKDPLKNSSGESFNALMTYNAMLDNIRLGAHTFTTFDYADIEWKLRLLTSQEYIDLRLDIMKTMEEKKCFEEWYSYFLLIVKTLSIALTPSPFKKEGSTIFSEKDLLDIPYDVLDEIYRKYIFFVEMSTRDVKTFTEEEVAGLLEVIRKKLVPLKDLERSKLLAVTNYLWNSYERLEKITSSVQNN